MLPSERYRPAEAGAVLGALQAIMAEHGYLPEDEVRCAVARLGVPLSQVFGAATFYAAFGFKPCGRHKLHVCEGTACYVKGSPALLAASETRLGVNEGETTEDGDFTLKRVRCVGSCGLAPVIQVDGETYGRLAPDGLADVLAKYG